MTKKELKHYFMLQSHDMNMLIQDICKFLLEIDLNNPTENEVIFIKTIYSFNNELIEGYCLYKYNKMFNDFDL